MLSRAFWGSYFERFSTLHCVLHLKGDKGPPRPTPASFACRLPLGNFLCLFIGILAGLQCLFLYKYERLSHFIYYIHAVSEESAISRIFVVREAVSIKDVNNAIRM